MNCQYSKPSVQRQLFPKMQPMARDPSKPHVQRDLFSVVARRRLQAEASINARSPAEQRIQRMWDELERQEKEYQLEMKKQAQNARAAHKRPHWDCFEDDSVESPPRKVFRS